MLLSFHFVCKYFVGAGVALSEDQCQFLLGVFFSSKKFNTVFADRFAMLTSSLSGVVVYYLFPETSWPVGVLWLS